VILRRAVANLALVVLALHYTNGWAADRGDRPGAPCPNYPRWLLAAIAVSMIGKESEFEARVEG